MPKPGVDTGETETGLLRPSRGQERGSTLEEQFVNQLRAAGLPEPVRELRFCETRKWRADFAYPQAAMLVEIQGGLWVRGRHSRAGGYQSDAEKYRTAQMLGWRVLTVTADEVKDGSGVKDIAVAYRMWTGESSG